MVALRLVLGDQLDREIASLQGLEDGDIVLLAEVQDEAVYVKHHKQKIALVLAAMRHFAEQLAKDGVEVDYVRLEDDGNTGSIAGEITRAVQRRKPDRVVVTAPGEWRLAEAFRRLREDLDAPFDILADDRFFATTERFAAWAGGRKTLRMEYFYRELRRETGILMDGDTPAGGQWNFDKENRKPPKDGLSPPGPQGFAPDAVTREALDLVARRFPDHFGDLEPFDWPVTRADALTMLDRFVAEALPNFGDYQDAMVSDHDFLFHSALSPAINIGLLRPREVLAAAEAAYRAGNAPINAVEGFIRQILGWREYVRGVYWLKMPGYAETNALRAERPLPAFYWTGATDMNCLAHAIDITKRRAYAHHIQRLMLTGNFALLAGIRPVEVAEWYLLVYADAFEWVELPNVQGMALFADGGLLASKPYAASGAYIDRMSDYCAGCAYNVKQKLGENACPFNYLYWSFLMRNRDRLRDNPRLAFPYKTLDRFSPARKGEIQAAAETFLDALD